MDGTQSDGGDASAVDSSVAATEHEPTADPRRKLVVVYLKGFCMGAADIVPGVSGGTIALITGIYERLVRAIAAIDPRTLRHVARSYGPAGRARLREDLAAMDLPFLLALGAGIGSAVLLVSRIITAAFESFPVLLNAFFFGLIAASAAVIYRHMSLATAGQVGVGVLGTALAFVLSGTASGGDGGSLPIVFLAGAIAISAMVLPGISGAAFLYILGQYEYLLGALTDVTDAIVALIRGGSVAAVVEPGLPVTAFLTGAVLGLLTMARIVKWALARYRIATLAFLVGLMVGALRLPVEQASDHAPVWTAELLFAATVAALVGAGAVIALDRYSDSLEYV